MSCYLVENLPYGFCPGCSHGLVVDGLGAALARLAPDPTKVVLVSDIGCVGLVDKHFAINTFHGLHGRSITYATGIKLARPDLDVFAVIGDGGCGIGGHHLIQAARRDVPIAVVVFNNFNYGMTGGEHSATTPIGAVTSSTPGGNVEPPMDLCALALAAGASFVARAAAFDREIDALLARAMRHPGFALVDVWELCTAYFMPNNAFRKKQLLALADELSMPFGVLRDAPRPRAKAAVKPLPPPPDLSPAFSSALEAPFGLLVAGSAGQKVKTAATTLGRAAIRSGLHVTQKDDYPITVKTGHSVAELVLSPRPIRFTGIERPALAVVLTEDGARRVAKKLAAMDAAGLVLAAEGLSLPATAAEVRRIDVAGAAKKVGKENVVLWAIARALEARASVPPAAFSDTVRRFTPARYREAATQATEAGAGFAADPRGV